MDEVKAIQRLKRGDIGGLDVLVERYQTHALRTAYLITRELALAQDVVQDSFINAYHAIAQFDLSRPFAPWFMRSVVNNAVKAANRLNGHHSLDAEDDVSGLADQLVDSTWQPEEMMATADLEAAVWQALGALSPPHRAVIVMQFYLEMSEAAMAEQLDIPVGTVKSRLHTARQQLRVLLYSAFSPEIDHS